MRRFRLEQFGKPLVEEWAEVPRPQGHEVVLRVASCGVCHSDVHLADGYFDLGNDNRIPLGSSVAPPRTLGHEIAGSVVACGPDVRGLEVDDLRVVYPWIGCGRCAVCQAGDEQLCNAPRAIGVNVDGGYAEHVLVPHEKYLFDFAPLDPDQACTYACSGLTAYGALRKVVAAFGTGPSSSSTPARSLLIVGAGGVGLSGIRMAASLGLPAPRVAEIDRGKWEFAQAAGASDVFDPTADGAARALVKATSGGVDAAIDFVGSAASFAFAFGALRKGGTLVSVGLIGGATTISPAMIAIKAITIVGSYVGSPTEMRDLMQLARTTSLPALPVTTLPLSAVGATLDALREGQIRGRAILKP